MSCALKKSALHDLGVKNFQRSFTWNLPASFVWCYFPPVRIQVALCIILVWVPLGWWIPVLSCVSESFRKLHFWQRWGAQCFLISTREAKAALFYTHKKPKSSSGWDSSCHFKRLEIFTGCWWKDPLQHDDGKSESVKRHSTINTCSSFSYCPISTPSHQYFPA